MHLLRQHVPAGRRLVEALEQPAPLALAEDRRAGGARRRRRARPSRLPHGCGVRYWRVSSTAKSTQPAVGERAVERHVRAARPADRRAAACARSRPGRRRRAARRNGSRGVVVLRVVVGVVVVDLVVVPGDDERERGVRGLQVGVGAVLRVAVPVAVERRGLGAGDRRGPGSPARRTRRCSRRGDRRRRGLPAPGAGSAVK